MKKIISIVFAVIMLTTMTACQKPAESTDFWSAVITAIEDKIGNDTNYNEDSWEIGIQGKTDAKNIKDRSLTIRRFYNDQTINRKVIFALQNENNTKYIDYIYERSEVEDDTEHKDIITIKSTDSGYTSYTIQYEKQEFRNGNYFDGSKANGMLEIQDDQSITYDNLPYLGETMEYLRTLLSDFQTDFHLNFQDYQDFINVPEIAKQTTFPEIEQVPSELSNTINYYSEPSINAKGYSIITFLEVEDNISAKFGRYSMEQKAFIENNTVPLEKRSIEHCFNIVQNDPDIPYAVYLQDDTAFIFKQALSDQEILDNVTKEAGNNANMILKTTNQGYE